MKKLLFFLLLGATISFTGCNPDDNNDNNGATTLTGTELSGDITEDTQLSADSTYTLTGTCSVKDGATLTIPAGTKIYCSGGFSSYLIVEQGGKIDAQGTEDAPIIFTSGESTPAAADWGGIILNGYAPISDGVGTTSTCEMDASVTYGGDDEGDNSGTLKYVEILYSGAQSSDAVEHNGLTLDAVGNGTTIENIYIAEGADDAIEFFGGTVNVTNLLAVNCDDDMFDVTQGWVGTLDNAYGIWEAGYESTESDPRGIEADGNFDGKYPDANGQSDFTMKNITINNASSYVMDDGIKVRRGATATITNALLIGGMTGDCINLDDTKSNANTETSISLTVQYVGYQSDAITATDTYDNVVIEDGNTGADESEFAWTNYDFSQNDMTEITSSSLSGDITAPTALSEAGTYTLDGTLSIKDGGSLYIPAGTTIKASKGFAYYVITEQGGRLICQGTADEPIVFTSGESAPAAGDWGGIILNGYASISDGVGTTSTCEMDASVAYGGDDDADNSGILKYVEILYSGAQNSETVEHNGLTLDAVGSGTTIENLYIAEGGDDAIEFFGGTVNVTNLLAVNCDDDMFDCTQGWTGTLDNAYGKWESTFTSGESDPRGIEADGNFDGKYPDANGQSNFAMSNITINNSASEQVMDDAIKVRRGATATITNCLVTGGGNVKNLVDLADTKGVANNSSNIAVTNSTVTLTGDEINRVATVNEVETTCSATVTVGDGNTGATTSEFEWTGYSF